MGGSNGKYSKSSTGDDIARDFGKRAIGKTFLITGGNVGLGLETGRVLAQAGGDVVLACRSDKVGEDAVKTVQSKLTPECKGSVSHIVVDLSDLKQVREAAKAYVKSGRRLDALINNAGVMASPHTLTKDGLEMQFGVNHVGHFVLTDYLLPALIRSGTPDEPARVINLSSCGQWIFAPADGFRWKDLDGKENYHSFERYGSSKLANLLHAYELNRRMKDKNVNVLAYSVHPGAIIATNLKRNLNCGRACQLMNNRRALWASCVEKMKSIPQGVATTLLVALRPHSELEAGGYYADCQRETKWVHDQARPASIGPVSNRLWTVTEQLVDGVLGYKYLSGDS